MLKGSIKTEDINRHSLLQRKAQRTLFIKPLSQAFSQTISRKIIFENSAKNYAPLFHKNNLGIFLIFSRNFEISNFAFRNIATCNAGNGPE